MAINIFCKCGFRHEGVFQNLVQAEVLADRHESSDYRRPYRHNTTLVEVK